ncbi:hypothetical protein BGW39_009048 [Mortierella sp. 14UC]|nr:hypothetical protein BGW39_009048 [Mortierella sp. 14UC]
MWGDCPREDIPLWYNEIENSIDYTPPTFRRFLHHTNATNKDTVSREEAIIFQLPRVLVVKEDKPTVFVQMREHNGFKDGIAVLFVRLVPAKEDDEDIKAEREDVEGEDDAEMEWDESQEAVDYEWGDDDHDNEEQEQEQEEEEEQDEDESENDGSAAGYGEESEGLEDDDNEEGGDEDVNTGGENSIVGDNGVSIVDGHSSAPPSPHGDEEEDYDARPYFIRLSGRSHHH